MRYILALLLGAGSLAMVGGADAVPINPYDVFIEMRVEGASYGSLTLSAPPNADGVQDHTFNIVACDGSVRQLLVASGGVSCDGSVREEMVLSMFATPNPGATVGVSVTGASTSYDIAAAIGIGSLSEGVYDLTLEGIYEIERLANPDLPNLAGELTVGPWDGYPLNPDDMLGGLVDGTNVIKHGTDFATLPEGELFRDGLVTSSGLESGFSQIVCDVGGCLFNRWSLISFSTTNPEGVLRRVRIESTLTASPGTLHEVLLPATGWLFLGGLVALGVARRKRSA